MTVVGGERVATTEQAGAGPMNRQQRREHFERLCAMRADYDRRGREDSTSAISIEAVIHWATVAIYSYGYGEDTVCILVIQDE